MGKDMKEVIDQDTITNGGESSQFETKEVLDKEIDINEGKLPQKELGKVSMIETNTVEEERRLALKGLQVVLECLPTLALMKDFPGHITYRDPEYPHYFWVNPFGMHFDTICVSDLLLVDRDGKVVQGDRPVNTAAFAIHSRLHEARPDVKAAAHSHSMYGKSFSSLGRLLDPITQDSCAFFNDHVLFDDFTGVVLETDEGDRIAEALGDKRAAILKNHGLLTTGETVDAALWGFLSMDRCCQSQLVAEAVGQVERISDETAEMTKGQVGSEIAFWLSYQPIYDLMLQKDDSFLN
ncbi:MAG: class II aldolase/adducin family protein [Gammaproteobacteria bacterium]|nr:MAG: class II aldolase/adducin family protein [Gammaproteobacteria bacterium]